MNKKLSQLTEKLTSLNADDLLYVSNNGVSKSIKASTLEAPLKAYADQKKSELISEIEAVEADLADEVLSRISADASNLTLANSYSDQKKSEVVALLGDETSARLAADSSTLSSAKSYTDSKHSDAVSEIEAVEASLNQEISNRVSGDSATLSSANSYADQKKSEVVSSINSEISRATTAETALGTRIDNVLSNIDPNALDSLSEVVAAFENADSNLNSAITTLATDLTQDLNQEISNRIYGQNVLQSAIDSEKSRAQTAESSLQSQISQEQSSRISADSAIDARLDVLEADPVTKAYVNSEVTDLENSISSVSSALDQEVSDRQMAVTGEETRAMASEASLQSQIDGLTTNDVVEGSSLYYTDERVQDKLANVTGHIIPDSDETYDLGTPTKKFRELHLSGNTIYLGEYTLSSSAEEGFVVTDPNNESAIVSDGIKEGAVNLFFTKQRVQETDLSMLDISKSGAVVSTDKLVDGVSKLQNSISAEVSARTAQDGVLNSKIDTEITNRTTQDGVLDAKINTEISNRVSGDGSTLTSANSYTDTAVDSVRMPVGAMHVFAGTVAPTGYLICNGSAVSRTTYSALFAVVGTSYGSGNGSSTFNLPNPDTNANLRYIIKV